MPPINQPPTLKLLIFEVTDGARTLTDDLAEQFVLFFNESPQWHSTIHQVDVAPGVHGHYEMRLAHRTVTCGHTPASQSDVTEAIDTLCHELCHPDGLLSPKRVNPNPNLVFTVGVDLFLHGFIKHSARSTASTGAAQRASTASSISRTALGDPDPTIVASATSVFLSLICKSSNQGPDQLAQVVIQPLATAAVSRVMKAIHEFYTSNPKDVDKTIKAVLSSFTELESIGTPPHDAPIDLSAARERFAELLVAISTATSQRRHGATYQNNMSIAMYSCGAATMGLIGCFLISPAVAAAVAASLSSNARHVMPLVSSLGAGAAAWMGNRTRNDMGELDEATKSVNEGLVALASAMLKSDYRHQPNAPMVARLAMDMAAACNPAMLDD